MEVVYYYDKDLEKSPVKVYLSKYLVLEKDSEIIIKRKQKILANIDAKINFVASYNGIPTPPISKPMHGYNFFEILNPKDERTVIRILYFCYQKKMVLLHAFEKPSSYSTNREKRKVEKQNEIAKNYQHNYKLSPENYEKYN